MNGMAVMLVEKSAFEVSPFGGEAVDHSASTSESVRGRGRGRGKATRGRGGNKGRGGGNALGKDYTESHGQKRGSHRGTDDSITPLDAADSTAEIPQDAPAEGLCVLIQATICRPKILSRIFKNSVPSMPVSISYMYSSLTTIF
jgi:hypothetical protein